MAALEGLQNAALEEPRLEEPRLAEPGLEEPVDHDDHAGGHASYSYATDWIDHSVDSELFHNSLGHHNPETWPINSSVGGVLKL